VNEALILWLALFAVMSAFIVAAGVLLARSGDRIADRTGLGGLLIGMVLVAAATSLPEIAVAVSAVLEGSPDLAIGNLLGSNMANMALLALVDLVFLGRVWHRASSGHGRTAAIAIALTAIPVLAILEPFEVTIGWVGIESIIIFVGFVSLISWTRRSPTPAVLAGETSHAELVLAEAEAEVGRAQPGAAPPSSRTSVLQSIKVDLVTFGVAALIILAAAPVLVISAEGIAAESGLGETFVGASFLAFATSLPELSTALAAVRIGAFDLAVGSLLGSNAFNMAIILVVDLFYLEGPILAHVTSIQAFVGVGAILLMSLVMAGIIHTARTRASRLEPSSWMVLIVYLLLMYVIWSAGPA
jgi:cation:H+ antiporter